MSILPQTRAPKRRIEKVRNRINFTMTASTVNIVLHAAEDSKTLVRTIIDLVVLYVGTSASFQDWQMLIQRAEGGTSTIGAIAAQDLDKPASNALIWEHSGMSFHRSDVGSEVYYRVQADIKGMRKLKELDKILLTHISSEASVHVVTGQITQFFKE